MAGFLPACTERSECEAIFDTQDLSLETPFVRLHRTQ
jgi:hypothetical protein